MAGISDIVGRTVVDFIDGAMVILTIMIIWYCIKFFLVTPPTKEEKEAKRLEDEERGKKFWGGVKEKVDKSKKEQEKQEKKDKISPAKKHLVKAQETSEYIMESLRRASQKSDLKKINEGIEDFEHHLHKAWKFLRVLRRNASSNEDKDHIHHIMEGIEVAKDHVLKEIKGKIPDYDADWATKVGPVLTEIGKLRAHVHNAWDQMMKYHA
jgi:hypothetical protein